MNYEDKYNKTIEAIKRIYEQADSFGKELMEKEFPELAESEDERIRKLIIGIFKDAQRNGVSETIMPEIFEEIFAWLEKQGEKANDERYKWLEELMKADTIYQMAINDEMLQEAKVKAVRALSKMSISKLLGFEKQGEQKPKEKPKVYDSMDDLIADAMIDEINESNMPESSKHNRVYWINSHRNKNIEWSEEDGLMLNSFLHKLEVCDLLSNKEITWIKNKLKYIKHWKPSKEQLEALWNATPHLPNSEKDIDVITELTTLYEDLKNL